MSKYRAIPTMVDGYRFASRAEARRFAELKLLAKAGLIWNLELQPTFPIGAGRVYRADFGYDELRTGQRIYEDVKGYKTDVYQLKKALVEAQYGIQIQEVR